MFLSFPLKEPFYLSLIQESYWNFDLIIRRFRSMSPGPKNVFGISFCSEGHFLSFCGESFPFYGSFCCGCYDSGCYSRWFSEILTPSDIVTFMKTWDFYVWEGC
jgi:hypothetical protein